MKSSQFASLRTQEWKRKWGDMELKVADAEDELAHCESLCDRAGEQAWRLCGRRRNKIEF